MSCSTLIGVTASGGAYTAPAGCTQAVTREDAAPDRVRLGGPGVFAGDRAWTPNVEGVMRISVGFAGTLVDILSWITKIVYIEASRTRGRGILI
ncbi:hypothetical protein [Micromonospora deserti]|uniref:hypothetical protein n=1 Tax=Micromonospora deserti TaxID=2070366 RepID=UPI0011B4ABB8|nr:hypothetical protein [Micromonospora deserti]